MSKVLGTVDGRPVTEDDVAAMVANAEAGFPGVTFRPVGRPAMGDRPARIVGVRIDPELDDALLTHIAVTGRTASDVVRVALREYLAPA